MVVPALISSADSWERKVIRQGKGFGWLSILGYTVRERHTKKDSDNQR